MNNGFISRNVNRDIDRNLINNYTRSSKKSNTNDKDNASFVNNKETYNQRIFDRNILSSQLSDKINTTPMYFTEQYADNRETSEKIFANRFENNVHTYYSHPRLGNVNFSSFNKDDARIEFKKNYNDYMRND